MPGQRQCFEFVRYLIQYYHFHNRTAYLHAAAMKEMDAKCPRMHGYLVSIQNWAIHELVAKGIPLYELQFSNSVEQVFAIPAIIEGRNNSPQVC